MPFEIRLAADAVHVGQQRVLLGTELLLDFLAMPDIIPPFLRIGLGIDGRIKSAARVGSSPARTNSSVSSTTRLKSSRGASS